MLRYKKIKWLYAVQLVSAEIEEGRYSGEAAGNVLFVLLMNVIVPELTSDFLDAFECLSSQSVLWGGPFVWFQEEEYSIWPVWNCCTGTRVLPSDQYNPIICQQHLSSAAYLVLKWKFLVVMVQNAGTAVIIMWRLHVSSFSTLFHLTLLWGTKSRCSLNSQNNITLVWWQGSL